MNHFNVSSLWTFCSVHESDIYVSVWKEPYRFLLVWIRNHRIDIINIVVVKFNIFHEIVEFPFWLINNFSIWCVMESYSQTDISGSSIYTSSQYDTQEIFRDKITAIFIESFIIQQEFRFCKMLWTFADFQIIILVSHIVWPRTMKFVLSVSRFYNIFFWPYIAQNRTQTVSSDTIPGFCIIIVAWTSQLTEKEFRKIHTSIFMFNNSNATVVTDSYPTVVINSHIDFSESEIVFPSVFITWIWYNLINKFQHSRNIFNFFINHSSIIDIIYEFLCCL